MRRTLIAVAATVGAALTGGLIAVEPALAASDTRVTVTVRPVGGPAKSAWLTCRPAGGSHRRAAEACNALSAAGGDPGAIAPADQMCTMDHAPVTAKVVGRWRGRAVRYKETFSNSCVMRRETGAVFRI